MFLTTIDVRRILIGLALIVIISLIPGKAFAEDDGNVLYLSEYLYGDYYYARLGDVEGRYTITIRPQKLALPDGFRQSVELGNHDVSPDGERIVFAARSTSDYDWDIFEGTIDLHGRRILDVDRIIQNVGTRDEDPRFSWDGSQIVYKCDGNICIYPDGIYANPVVESWCELWAPSFESSGYTISYTKRCAGPSDDKTWHFNLLSGSETGLPSDSDSTDRFSHFLDDGRIVFSRSDIQTGRSSLWVYDSGIALPLHDRTDSDDDPYPDKHDRNHIAFIGWQDGGYDLYIYRQATGDSVRLSNGLPIIAPVLFRVEESQQKPKWFFKRPVIIWPLPFP